MSRTSPRVVWMIEMTYKFNKQVNQCKEDVYHVTQFCTHALKQTWEFYSPQAISSLWAVPVRPAASVASATGRALGIKTGHHCGKSGQSIGAVLGAGHHQHWGGAVSVGSTVALHNSHSSHMAPWEN